MFLVNGRKCRVKEDRVTELRNRLAETSIVRTIRLSYRATYIFTKPPDRGGAALLPFSILHRIRNVH